MKLIGKLEDGTVFFKKGHDEDELFEFKTDEGIWIFHVISLDWLDLFCFKLFW